MTHPQLPEGGPVDERAVIVLGCGGHAAVVIDALQVAGRQVLGAVGPRDSAAPLPVEVAGAPVLGTEAYLDTIDARAIALANGVGGGNTPELRRSVYERWTARGFEFTRVIHPAAIVSPRTLIGVGVQIMAGAIVQARAQLDENALVNTGASIDHDCHIGAHAHVAPRVTLCGQVSVGDTTLIGAGSVVVPAVSIGRAVLVRAASLITAPVADAS